jgi:ribonuclease HI
VERHSNERIIKLEVYTDGSLKKTGKSSTFGGWAYIVVQDGKEIYNASGNEYNTTNQRMELLAIANALEYAKSIRRNAEKVVIYSDSAYAINCYLQEWYLNWQTNGWRNANKQEVANQDLWQKIIPYFDNFWYDFKKVKGHDGNYWNEQCDKLAQTEAETLKTNWRGIKNVK